VDALRSWSLIVAAKGDPTKTRNHRAEPAKLGALCMKEWKSQQLEEAVGGSPSKRHGTTNSLKAFFE
jgi:hypothetical protein